jgi:hypothetical protein
MPENQQVIYYIFLIICEHIWSQIIRHLEADWLHINGHKVGAFGCIMLLNILNLIVFCLDNQ